MEVREERAAFSSEGVGLIVAGSEWGGECDWALSPLSGWKRENKYIRKAKGQNKCLTFTTLWANSADN